jgi:hypothetical protein
MEMTSVQSSQVESIGYDAATKTMAVQFHNGGLYRYDGVPPDVYEAALKAQSVGKFLAQSIKKQYRHHKVEK